VSYELTMEMMIVVLMLMVMGENYEQFGIFSYFIKFLNNNFLKYVFADVDSCFSMCVLSNHCFACHLIKKLNTSAFFEGKIGGRTKTAKKHII